MEGDRRTGGQEEKKRDKKGRQGGRGQEGREERGKEEDEEYERWRRRKNIIWRRMEGKDEEERERESGG